MTQPQTLDPTFDDNHTHISHRIHVWNIYLHNWAILGVNLSKFSTYMEHLGMVINMVFIMVFMIYLLRKHSPGAGLGLVHVYTAAGLNPLSFLISNMLLVFIVKKRWSAW